MTDPQDLIRRLRERAQSRFERDMRDWAELKITRLDVKIEDYDEWQAATALETLVKERGTIGTTNPTFTDEITAAYQNGLRDGARGWKRRRRNATV